MSKRQGVKRGTDAHNAYIKDVMAQEEAHQMMDEFVKAAV